MILKQFPERQEFLSLAKNCNAIPICTQILADTQTPVLILQKFYDKEKESFLLESVEGGERWARYSFIGVSAFGTIKIFSKDVEIETKKETRKIAHNNDPLKVVRKFSKGFIPAQIPELPMFWSGLTGYFTYEMVSFFENIPVSLPKGMPYAHFIIPDEMIIFDNMKQTLTCLKICYIKDYDDHETIFKQAQNDLGRMLDTINTPFVQTKPFQSLDVKLEPETKP